VTSAALGDAAARVVTSVGHGNLTAEHFGDLLTGAGIERLVDIRRYPGSRKFPWFGSDAMSEWLPGVGVDYVVLPQLGGRRRPVAGSPNTAWRVEQFAAYADHMATAEFSEGVDELLGLADRPLAMMCSESLWWRCHRRLVADHLVLVEGVRVEHLFPDGSRRPHDPMEAAVLVDGRVEYPDSQPESDAGLS